MRKNIVFLLAFLTLIVFIFSISVNSAGNGCCYTDTQCIYGVAQEDCSGTYSENNYWCVDVPICQLGCCCGIGLSGADLITTQARCTYFSGDFLAHPEWSTSDYLTNYGIYGPENSNINTCTVDCGLGLLQCTYTNCEQENTEDCICGSNVADATNGRYCCLTTGNVFSTAENCNAECQAEDNIYGTVRDSESTALLSGVLITTASKSTTTDASGAYSLDNIPSSGSLTASKDGYLARTLSYDTSQGNEFNFVLYSADLGCSVEGDTRACDIQIDGCDTQRVCENRVFSECRIIPETCPVEAVCGNNEVEAGETCEIINGIIFGCAAGATDCVNCNQCVYEPKCGDAKKNQVTEQCDPDRTTPETFAGDLLVQCGDFAINCTLDCKCVFEPATCGDKVLGYAEQCEWEDNITYTETTIPSLCNADYCGKPGEPLACKCKAITSCGDGYISGTETCEQDSDCPNSESCVDCLCSGTCTEAPALALDYDNGDVDLTWTLPYQDCISKLENYYVYRCEADDNKECIDGRTQAFYVSKDLYDYTDSISPDNTDYCYWVEAVYVLEQGTVSSAGNKECINSGYSFCVNDVTTEFCQDNSVMRCNNTQTIVIEECDSDYQACVSDNGGAECVYRANCDYCNGLFDMFYLEGYTYDESGNLVSCEEVDVCYIDSTPTTVDKYYSCYDNNVDSCYDYLSEAACSEDTCGVKNCDWQASPTYGDLGLGVCRSTVDELQDCRLCHDPENFIFGECTKEYCGLYGDCYFDELINVNNGKRFGCMQKSRMSCDYYDLQEECGSDAEVDTAWDESFLLKINGSNEITARSTDPLDLGICKWLQDEESCAKDADNNTINNVKIDGTGGANNKFDCSFDDLKCQRDHNAPNTTIIYGSVVPKNINLDYVVYDNSYNKQNINTYTCLVGHGEEPCYPDKSTRDTNFKIMQQTPVSGVYDMYYFSEDYAHNLEEVKTISLAVDADVPVVVFDYKLDSKEIDPENFPGLWLTNLSVSFNISNKNATCSANLTLDGSSSVRPSSDLNGVWGDKFNLRYNYLEDGSYTLILVCKDAIGNQNEPTFYAMPILADSSITNPQPSITLNSGENITISVETASDAICKYDFTEDSYAQMSGTFSTTDGVSHSDTIDIGGEGIIIINVKCNFTNTGKVYGNYGDKIKFAIDKTPPETLIVDEFNQTKDISGWQSSVYFFLLCKDSPIYENNNPYLKNWAYGCKSLYYAEDGTPENKFVDYYFISLYEPNIYELAYYSVDNGDNADDVNYKNIYIDNVNYGFDILIKDFFTREYVDIVRADRTYEVEVNSPKTSLVTYDTNYKIYVNSLTFKVKGKHTIVNPASDYITYSEPWIGYFQIDGDEFKDIDNAEAKFYINGKDSHEIESSEIVFGETFTVDTKLPEQPKFDPILSDYASLDYPLHEYDGIFYTNDMLLFVTANYSEEKTNLSFYLERSNLPIPQYFIDYYDQGENGDLLATKILHESADEDSTVVYITGDAGPFFIADNYVEFVGYNKEEYEHYKELYKIEDVEYILIGDNPVTTKLTISPTLEKDLLQGISVNAYDAKYPTSWAGLNLIILYQGENNLTLEVSDEAGNTNKDEAILYLDTVWPVVVESSLYPEEYFSTNNNNTNISIIIREVGSGLDSEIINFTITALDTNVTYTSYVLETYNCNYDLTKNENGDYICNKITFVPSTDLENSLYEAKITAYDLAHNLAQRTWYFFIEAGSPDRPEFRLKNALAINPDPDNIWYINKTNPEFTLDFSDPESVTVFLTILYNETGYNNDTIISCEQTDNFFDCSFIEELSEQEYSVEVFAYKTLSDGSISPTGRWTFWFTIDQTDPEFELYYNNITNPNVDIDFYGFVENEADHNLLGYFFINGQEEDMLYSYSPGEGRIFKISDGYDWALDEPVKDFNITIRIMDYAGNANEKTYWLRIDDETPKIYLTEVKAKPIFIRKQPEFYTEFVEEADVILAAEYANVTGTIEEGYKGFDISDFYVIDPRTEPTTVVQSTNLDNLDTLGNMQGVFIDGVFKVNLLMIGQIGEETLNNMNFIVKDYAENMLNTYLGVLKDLKPPQLLNITVS